MELGLSLGHASKHQQKISINNGDFDFRISLGLNSCTENQKAPKLQQNVDNEDDDRSSESDGETPIQLNLLPIDPVPRSISKLIVYEGSSENGSSGNLAPATETAAVAVAEEVSSENRGGSPFCLDFRMYGSGGTEEVVVQGSKRDHRDAAANDGGSATSRGSDEDDNGANNRKKLRLSKEQSAFLEESFKEHNTLNPKQKLGLAKQLNLRPRQVEVWFQNRRARTKLKQTEVDCEYLKRCCDTLTEENRRLQKEVQELRALKASNNSIGGQRPPTTLTMCPSCERVSTTAPPPPHNKMRAAKAMPLPLNNRPRFYPFSQKTMHLNNNQPAAL